MSETLAHGAYQGCFHFTHFPFGVSSGIEDSNHELESFPLDERLTLTYSSHKKPITNCYRLLFPHLAAASYTHAFILSTPSHTIPEDKGGIRWFALITTIRTFANSMYTEILATADFVTKQKDVPWTLFRVPILGSGDVKEVKAGATGDGAVGMSIARASVAGWVLKALNEGEKWEGKAPLLSDV